MCKAEGFAGGWIGHGRRIAVCWIIHGRRIAVRWIIHGRRFAVCWIIHGRRVCYLPDGMSMNGGGSAPETDPCQKPEPEGLQPDGLCLEQRVCPLSKNLWQEVLPPV
jgi:hypothetical protein